MVVIRASALGRLCPMFGEDNLVPSNLTMQPTGGDPCVVLGFYSYFHTPLPLRRRGSVSQSEIKILICYIPKTEGSRLKGTSISLTVCRCRPHESQMNTLSSQILLIDVHLILLLRNVLISLGLVQGYIKTIQTLLLG